jgi:hypothetical protein
MTTYNQLKNIIPADQALASKALQAGLEQVKNIRDTTLPAVSNAAIGLETTKGLDGISSLTAPLPANVIAYYETQFYNGSGPYGTLYLTDIIGTPTGCIVSPLLQSVSSTLNTMTVEGDFATLTNPSNGVYTVMENCIAGDYTTSNTDPFTGNTTYTVVIPPGLPGAGTYGPANTASEVESDAFSGGLNPAMISLVGVIVAANPVQVANTTAEFGNICVQIITENTNLALADVQFANLLANQTPWSLVYGLAADGLDTTEGGSAYVLQSLANLSTQGGQAIIATMREARNQARLSTAGLETDITVSDTGPTPQADLGRGEYTAAEASDQKTV